jgi:hypothetical protein
MAKCETGAPFYVITDGRVVDSNRQSPGSYVLRVVRSGK